MTMNIDGRSNNLMRKTVDVRIHSFSLSVRLLEHELHLPEQLIQRLARIDHIRLAKVAHRGRAVARSIREDVAKAAARLQSGGAKRQREVIDQKRAIGHTQTVIETDVVANVI